MRFNKSARGKRTGEHSGVPGRTNAESRLVWGWPYLEYSEFPAERRRWARADQGTVPKMAPIPAVTPIASAPQNVTRMVGFRMFAPPALAPIMPSKARNTKEPTETVGILQLDG